MHALCLPRVPRHLVTTVMFTKAQRNIFSTDWFFTVSRRTVVKPPPNPQGGPPPLVSCPEVEDAPTDTQREGTASGFVHVARMSDKFSYNPSESVTDEAFRHHLSHYQLLKAFATWCSSKQRQLVTSYSSNSRVLCWNQVSRRSTL